LKTIEPKKGKPAIVVGAKSKLDTVLVTFIAAAMAGELDGDSMLQYVMTDLEYPSGN
jgi:hypothetical protein